MDHHIDWQELDANTANNLIETNKKGDTISSLEDFAIVLDKDDTNNLSLKTESITRFDRPMHRKLNKLGKT